MQVKLLVNYEKLTHKICNFYQQQNPQFLFLFLNGVTSFVSICGHIVKQLHCFTVDYFRTRTHKTHKTQILEKKFIGNSLLISYKLLCLYNEFEQSSLESGMVMWLL